MGSFDVDAFAGAIDLLTGNAMFMVVLSSSCFLRGPAIGYDLLEDGDTVSTP